MFQTQNLCPGSKMSLTRDKNIFLFSEQQNLFPQHMFPARLNWETFASATMFPSLARPLVPETRLLIILLWCVLRLLFQHDSYVACVNNKKTDCAILLE